MSNSHELFYKVRLGFVFLLIVTLALGCVSTNRIRPMALNASTDYSSLGTNSIALFTIKSSNVYRERFQPRVRLVNIKKSTGTNVLSFAVDASDAKSFTRNFKSILLPSEKSYEYLVSVNVPPGEYLIENMTGISFGMSGLQTYQQAFDAPINAQFTVPANAVTYIGHLDVINRERKKGEPGKNLGFLERDDGGFIQGVFEATISDMSESDLPLFIQNYPSLQNIQIRTVIMRGSSAANPVHPSTSENTNRPSATIPESSSPDAEIQPAAVQQATQSADSYDSEKINKLRQLKKLKDDGILTDEEYEQRRKAIVDKL